MHLLAKQSEDTLRGMKKLLVGITLIVTIAVTVAVVRHEREQNRKLAHIVKIYGIMEQMTDHMDHIATNCMNARLDALR